jgi:hypothetical protein
VWQLGRHASIGIIGAAPATATEASEMSCIRPTRIEKDKEKGATAVSVSGRVGSGQVDQVLARGPRRRPGSQAKQ